MVKKVFLRRSLLSNSPKKLDINSLAEEEFEDDLPKGGNKVVIGVFIALIIFGVLTGYLLSRGINSGSGMQNSSGDSVIIDGKTSVGVSDTRTFKDSAIGVLDIGGLDGEGTHKLIRDGGPSQTVYMISSVIDLDQFVGKKVTIWGQTMAAKKVPWLMDVGRVDLEE